MPFSFGNLAASRLICEECPSRRSTTGRAGGIDGVKWPLSQPQKSSESIHPDSDLLMYAPFTKGCSEIVVLGRAVV